MAKKKSNEKVTRKPVAAPRKAVAAKPRKVLPPAKAMSRKRHPKRDLAKTMFLAADMTATDIANQLGIQLKTISSWRKEDNWDDERTYRKVSTVQMRKRILESIEEILDVAQEEKRAITNAEVDNITKLSKAAGYFLNEVGPQIILEVLYAFLDYADQRDHDFALKLGPMSLDYVTLKQNEAKGM